MKEILLNFNQNLTQTQLLLLEEFKNLLLFYNKRFNLTSIIDDKEFYIKHICDSLSGARFFKQNADAAEVGSGGGFPSIPLKIIRPDIKFTLIESVAKKCNFLKIAAKQLELENVQVLNMRAEDAARNVLYREKFEVVCARAVAYLSSLCEYCSPLVKPGGIFLAYKTYNKEEIQSSENAQKQLQLALSNVHKYELFENMGSRAVLVFDKKGKISPKYPRGQGKERSKPL